MMALKIQPLARAAWSYVKSVHFLASAAALLAALIAMAAARVDLQWWWLWLFAAISVPFSPLVADPVRFFRGGLSEDARSKGSFSLLAVSAFVSWVFAKSILNASTLGAKYGLMGGLAYATWYTAFASVGGVAYLMRTRFGYRSLPAAVHARYGSLAAAAFGLAVAYRLLQEVWSNSVVVASFYGPVHSPAWWAAACLSAAIPALYSFTGGLRASLLTDSYQGLIKTALLVVVLAVLGSQAPTSLGAFNPGGRCDVPPAAVPADATPATCYRLAGVELDAQTGAPACAARAGWAKFTPGSCSYSTINASSVCTSVGGAWTPPACVLAPEPACAAAGAAWAPRAPWSLAGGLDLAIVGLLQGSLSYAFFDPVLTDRAFLASPRVMLAAFLVGGAASALFIVLFSFVGVFGAAVAALDPARVACGDAALYAGMLGGAPDAVARFFGPAVFSVVNLIFIISSCAVLDSTFSSTAKLAGCEGLGALERGRPLPPQAATRRHAWVGRAAIVLMAVVGTLPLLSGPSALDATTISGTMVVGLGPPMLALTFIRGYRPLVFHLPFWTGVALGVVMQLGSSVGIAPVTIGSGHYAGLLGWNVVSTVCCWVLGALALLDNRAGRGLAGRVDDDGREGEEEVGVVEDKEQAEAPAGGAEQQAVKSVGKPPLPAAAAV